MRKSAPGVCLQRLTDSTLTRAQALRDECDRIVNDGHAIDREGFISGLVALAVPLRAVNGGVCAAIAVHAHAVRMTAGQALERLPALREAARRMARLL